MDVVLDLGDRRWRIEEGPSEVRAYLDVNGHWALQFGCRNLTTLRAWFEGWRNGTTPAKPPSAAIIEAAPGSPSRR
jgi:hypothetical protein